LKKRLSLVIYSIALSFCISYSALNAQILKDSASLHLVRAGIEDIYNFRFNEAENACKILNKVYPEHPVVYLLQGMIKYWKYFPLIPSSGVRTAYEKDLRKCIELCENKKSKTVEAEYLLANLSARGMLLLFYVDNNLSSEVIPLAISTYQYIMRTFDYTSAYNDFYFFTGLYNYYREAYPKVYPMYRVVAFLLPKGDRAKGLNELNIAATNSIFLKAEASLFLSSIYSSFESDFRKATDYSKSLHQLYHYNHQYLVLYIKNMFLIKKYDEAEKLIISASGQFADNSFINAEITILSGLLHEKKYQNKKIAEQYYLRGIKALEPFGHIGNEFSAYGYFGLSRLSQNTVDKNSGKSFRKKALALADFKNINFD
jgi:hypothetical protein